MQNQNDKPNAQAVRLQNTPHLEKLQKIQYLVQDFFEDIALTDIQDALFAMMSRTINPAEEPYELAYVADLHHMQGRLLMLLTKLKEASAQAQAKPLPVISIN